MWKEETGIYWLLACGEGRWEKRRDERSKPRKRWFESEGSDDEEMST
jgi:hypothetical protein